MIAKYTLYVRKRSQQMAGVNLYHFHLSWLQMIDMETRGLGDVEIDV